ncbi:RAP domain-containing protein [Durusdinium trenchii]|uniref:RAP domain-containing protein n=1 Tax=Durusdinium trenchii TaxID=1381693 RepID=A0ABP0H543_9DINO
MFVGVLGPQRVPSAGSSDHSMVLGQVGGRTRGAPVSEWSADPCQVRKPALMGAITGSILTAMEHLGPQNVANSVWAWATLRYHNVSALSAMAALAVKSGDARGRFKVWAFAKLHVQQEALMAAVGEAQSESSVSAEAIHRMSDAGRDDFDAMCVASISWAFATLGHWDEPLLEMISATVEKRVGSCKTQERPRRITEKSATMGLCGICHTTRSI